MVLVEFQEKCPPGDEMLASKRLFDLQYREDPYSRSRATHSQRFSKGFSSGLPYKCLKNHQKQEAYKKRRELEKIPVGGRTRPELDKSILETEKTIERWMIV